MVTRAECLETAFMAELMVLEMDWLHHEGVMPRGAWLFFAGWVALGFGSWLALWLNGLPEFPPDL